MINLIRHLLRGTLLYGMASRCFHSAQNFISRATLLFSRTKYLPPIQPLGKYKSQFGQDYYLDKLGLLPGRGFFVEVGANHPVNNSNSHFLELELGWSGISIDGIDYGLLYEEHRPRTRFVHCLVDRNVGDADFFQVVDVDGWENQLSSMHDEALKHGRGVSARHTKVKTMPLSLIVEQSLDVDLCLIDVEGHELEVLESIDWTSMRPRILLIENNGQFYARGKLCGFMAKKGYRHFARIGSSDDIFVIEQ